jgi:hypothetical protein
MGWVWSLNLRIQVIDIAYAVSDRFPLEGLKWGDCGPKLLTMLVRQYPQLRFDIKPPDFANPVDYWRCATDLYATGGRLPEGARFVHCYNEMLRRAGVDKNAIPPAGSIMRKMMDDLL